MKKPPSGTDEEFIAGVLDLGAAGYARKCGISVRNVYARKARIEQRLRCKITDSHVAEALKEKRAFHQFDEGRHPSRYFVRLGDGVVLVGSDTHYWPGVVSTAHRAFVKCIGWLRPKVVVLNGDVFDGASVSRHPSIGWESKPSVIQEIEACQERLGEIEAACLPECEKVWNLGNHDSRFETRLANAAPEFANVHGVHLKDHFPGWECAWSCWINDDVVIKHRARSGVHAAHNNTVNAGKTLVTGHLHSLKVTPFTDYNGTRFGVDTGTIADVHGPKHQFIDYTEDSPLNWRSGFAVLTFVGGKLL